jgi:hypothetical protein
MAAGRPAIACAHPALTDYIHDRSAFVVTSHSEPTSYPVYPLDRYATRRQHVDWQSLHDQIRNSYDVARNDQEEYRLRSGRARAVMSAWAAEDRVESLLKEALVLIEQEPRTFFKEKSEYSKAS